MSASCIWVAVAAYRSTNATASVICLDPATLAVSSSFEVQDHIGAMAVAGDALVGMNWDARQLYAWKADGTLISKTDSPSDGRYQDCDSGSAGPFLCVTPEGSAAEVDALAFDGASGWSVEAVRRVELPGASLGQEGFKPYGSFWLYAPDDFSDAKVHVIDSCRSATGRTTNSVDGSHGRWMRSSPARRCSEAGIPRCRAWSPPLERSCTPLEVHRSF